VVGCWGDRKKRERGGALAHGGPGGGGDIFKV